MLWAAAVRCCAVLPRGGWAMAGHARGALGLARASLTTSSDSRPPRVWSPSELVQFTESPWAAWLERLSREEASHEWASHADPPDPMLQMLARKGTQAEATVLEDLFGGKRFLLAFKVAPSSIFCSQKWRLFHPFCLKKWRLFHPVVSKSGASSICEYLPHT